MIERWRFVNDDDGHYFLIPDSLHPLFIQMLDQGEADYWTEFNNKFDEYAIDHPSNYTFENPLG